MNRRTFIKASAAASLT
ncbi:MAG: twin-arginine translocation signal domain-containing protein, partial [Verrucomicrobiae bacterium]|nr:twin-arginine translocation signal domain-containing protein [Verrucomicrobiae bacterium]